MRYHLCNAARTACTYVPSLIFAGVVSWGYVIGAVEASLCLLLPAFPFMAHVIGIIPSSIRIKINVCPLFFFFSLKRKFMLK